jgi:PIN domain nuclease of toxin-antitoxin system
MKILLDTHIFIWMATEPERLSIGLSDAIINPHNSIFLSLVSIWEIQIKVALGRLDLMADLETIIDSQIKSNGIQLLPINLQHIYALKNLPSHHGDPFDRLLIAQSQIEQMTLATVDRLFDLYDIDRI